MNRNRLFLVAGLLAVLALGAWFYMRSGLENVAVDLVKDLATAKARLPKPEAFSIIDATINGQKKQAIFTKEFAGTRIIWHETIPDNGWLKVSIGLLEDGWKVPGDGVLFRVGVSASGTYDELLNYTMNPSGVPQDRRWNDVMIDLSQYAGETLDIIFNTNSSTGGKDDRNGDFAVWGDPRIVVR